MGLNCVRTRRVYLLTPLLMPGVAATLETKDIIGLAVGGSIGGVIFFVLIIVLIILLCRPSKKKSAEKKQNLVRKDSPRSGSGSHGKKKHQNAVVPPGIWTSNPTMWATGHHNGGISTLPPPGYHYKAHANGHTPAPMLMINGNVENGKKYPAEQTRQGRQPWYQRTLRALKRLPAVFQVRHPGEYQEFRDGTFSSGAVSTLPPGGYSRGKSHIHGYEVQRGIQNGGSGKQEVLRQVRVSDEQPKFDSKTEQELINSLINRQGTVTARVYSDGGWQNSVYVAKPRPTSKPNSATKSEQLFVAKAYSDYRDPKDFLGSSKSPTDETGEYVARAFSSYNSNINRSGTDSGVASAGNSSRESGNRNVARAVVSGDPRNGDIAGITQSEWTLDGTKDTRGKVTRTQSALDRSHSHVVVSRTPRTGAREGASGQPVTRGKSMIVTSNGLPGRNPYAPGILIRSDTNGTGGQSQKKKVFTIGKEHRSGDSSVRPLSLGDVPMRSPVVQDKVVISSQNPRPSTQVLNKSASTQHEARLYSSQPSVARDSESRQVLTGPDNKHYSAPDDPHAVYATPVKVIRVGDKKPRADVTPNSPSTPLTPPVPPPMSAYPVEAEDGRKHSRGSRGRVGQLNSIEEAEDHHVVGDAFKFLDDFEDNASYGDDLGQNPNSRL